MARRVSQEEGLLIGGSCGTAVAAALQVADECGPADLIALVAAWNDCRGGAADVNDDGRIDAGDFIALTLAWDM